MYLFIVTDWSKLKKNYVSSSLLNLGPVYMEVGDPR